MIATPTEMRRVPCEYVKPHLRPESKTLSRAIHSMHWTKNTCRVHGLLLLITIMAPVSAFCRFFRNQLMNFMGDVDEVTKLGNYL